MSRGGKKYLDFPPLSDISLILSGGTAGFRAIFALLRGDCQNPAGQGRGPGPCSTYPTGSGGSYPPRGAAPRGDCLPAASISPVRNGGKNTRGFTPGPLFQGRSLLARSVLGWETQRGGRGFDCGPCTCPDLETFFWENIFRWIFLGGTAFIQAEVPFRLYRGGFPTHASQPAQLGGGPLPTLDTGPQARIQKKRDTPKDIPH